MPAIAFISQADDPVRWRKAMAKRLPDLDFRVWPDVGDASEIAYALVWKHKPGELNRFPNLKLLCSLGAGVDHVFADPSLPRTIPLVRIVDPDLTAGVSEYVLLSVLRYHRQFPQYEALQRERRWRELGRPATADCRVGILGLGVLGRDAAAKLRMLGFPVLGWARRPRPIEGMETYSGEDGLQGVLARTRILVCMLPLTAATAGIINARTLGLLPLGAYFVNVARGANVVDRDLIAALDSGHISGATLDVFSPEPLPGDHPFWVHPKVTVTPHIAALTNPDTAADQIAENISRSASGRPLLHAVDPEAGY